MLNQPTGPDTPPDGNFYNNMKNRAFYWFLSQGAGIVFLFIACFFLWKELKEIRLEEKACQQEIIQLHASQNEKLIQALDKLNRSLEDIKKNK